MDRLHELKGQIEEAIGWLESALRNATSDPETCDEWPALSETAAKIDGALKASRGLLPLHAEIEAAIKEESERWDDYDPPEAIGLGRR